MKTAEEMRLDFYGENDSRVYDADELYLMKEYAKDYTLHKGFWQRLEMFVKGVQVNDEMSEEEKEMILSVCKDKLKQ